MPEMSDSSSDSDDYSEYDYQLDLSETLRHEIENEEYVCLICTGEIGIHSKIWSCRNCYRVYDLACIKKWSERGTGKQDVSMTLWKCPSCNCVHDEVIDEYRCWCGKISDPFYNGLIPHSCGQTCGYKLSKCIHLCSEMCHPGPHTECTAMGPSMPCLCGKLTRQWPCIITPYETGWQCKSICGELLPCGEHRCSRPCHSGLCGACSELVDAQCYCGSTTKQIACGEQRPELSETDEGRSWVGKFSCEKPCAESLSCGNHACTRKCHPRRSKDHECPKQPPQDPLADKCACGQTVVMDILGRKRESCLEDLPVCTKFCPKTLRCGHKCISKCHSGTCPPCREIITVKCACESQLLDVPCAFKMEGSSARCAKRCNALMDCRRHRCVQVCCAHEKTAFTREKARKRRLRGVSLEESTSLSRASTPPSADVIETVHQCQETCNILLNCGKHRCMFTCHSGPCHPCLESSLDDWTCPCGQTVVRAPIRCGSVLKCHFSCTRRPPCGHEPVDHECHDDTIPCPQCPHIVTKQCICKKSMIKGVRCSAESVSCGRACGKPLSCGHNCSNVCHKEGECQTVCKRICGRVRPCNHRDRGVCHAGSSCDEASGPCKEPVTLRCICGNLRKDECCSGGEKPPVLDCDDSCAILERNRKLAVALQLEGEKQRAASGNAGPDVFHEYDDTLLDIYYADKEFGDTVERDMIAFVEQNVGSYRFPSMKSNRRLFIHMLAAEYGVTSVSQDSEPNRSVVLIRSAGAKVPANRLKESTNPFLKLSMR